MLTIFMGAFFILPLVLLFLIGVDAWMGLTSLDFSGLENDGSSDSTENWFCGAQYLVKTY